jgi:CRISPR-associated protein Csm3
MSDKMVLKDYIILEGVIHCVTGLRVGGPGDIIEIGGLDNPIIKHPLENHPYIPGSSLKGKMRSLLELRHDKIDPRPKVKGRNNRDYGEVHKPGGWNCGGDECIICRLFGSNAGEGELGPSRLIVRDAEPTAGDDGWMARFRQLMEEGQPYTERKWENTINRITAMANPRQMERVPAGAEFDFQLVYRIFDTGDGGAIDHRLFKHVLEGLLLVQNDALGGSGSRGYGRVEFRNLKATNLKGEPLLDKIDLQRWESYELPAV